jgi:dTDP-4-dehydrorhamnose reductase
LARKILITGAEGQLGKALQISLSDKFKLLPTSRKPTQKAIKNRNVHKLDITVKEDIAAVIASFKPDIIINCAAYTDVDGSEKDKDLAHKVNVSGLQNLIQLSEKETFFIQISSDYVFDGNNGPYAEDDHTFPVNYYGKTKLEAENMLRGMRRRFLIFRPNVLYGEDLFSKGNFFAWVYKSLLNGKSISVVTDQISNPVYVQNFVNAIFKCIIMNCEGIYHFGSDDYISRYEFARNIAQIFNFELSLVEPIETKTLAQKVKSYIAKRPINSGLKTEKIEQEVSQTIYSTLYSLKQLKNNLALT